MQTVGLLLHTGSRLAVLSARCAGGLFQFLETRVLAQFINLLLQLVTDAGDVLERLAPSQDVLVQLVAEFRDRLAGVRVCCGDWSRVCGPFVTFKHGVTGVFLDPPYSEEAGRDMRCYAVDCGKVAHAVREWAIEMGQRRDMRIVLASYEGEHQMPADWRVVAWKARGGMANQGNNRGRENAKRERLWMSPHCLAEKSPLFGRAGA